MSYSGPKTHAERCASIVDMLRENSLIPQRKETTFDQVIKDCQVCGQPFTGSFKKKVCSRECVLKIQNKASRKSKENRKK